MKKILLALTLVFLLVGCAQSNKAPGDNQLTPDTPLISETSPNRKIIYTITTTLYEDDINESANAIKNLMVDDDFLSDETRENNRIFLRLRIKTTRLNDFVSSLKSGYELHSFRLSSKDVSLEYQDLSNRKLTYEKEYTRLQDMLDTADFDQTLIINKRMSELEVLIAEIDGSINIYDSLIDYSTVEITIYESYKAPKKSFMGQVGSQIVNGWNGLIVFLQFLILALVTLLPWMIIIVPVGVTVYFIIRYQKKRKPKDEE